ncbi:MAG: phage tail protein [Rhodospirillaceae bacterium]|nr:phage tail protein [Rhodospirillales bacterium]
MDPFLGEIRYFAFGYAPDGWAECNGALLTIQQNTALYSLLGIQYGGNASLNFNLPDLRGRAPLGMGRRATDGAYFTEAQKLGSETIVLSSTQVPSHTHQLNASAVTPVVSADNKAPTDNLTGHAATGGFPPVSGVGVTGIYNNTATATTPITLHTNTVATVGGNVGHENCAPSMALMACIAISGLYPTRP